MSGWGKRIVMVIMMLVMVVGNYPGWIASDGTVHAAGGYAGGDGTSGDPYQIATADQLYEIRSNMDSHFILINDIDLGMYDSNNSWVPIGSDGSPFEGSLDGQNYKITNLYINNSNPNQSTGLFGDVATSSDIRNLVVEVVEVRGIDNVGALIGVNRGVINHVSVTGSVYGKKKVGGLVGLNESGDISFSYATGNVNGERNVGGLVGLNEDGDISYSYATGNIDGLVDVGGLLGGNDDGNVSFSYATGNVTGEEDVGGLVADNDGGIISDSYATGSVDGSDSVGGLVGDNKSGTIINSYSIGPVTGNISVGGLVGIVNNRTVINNSYYDTDTSGQSDNQGQGLSSNEMKNKNGYTGWDFDTYWEADLHHNGYPYLKAIQAFVTYAGNGKDNEDGLFISHPYIPNSLVTIQGNQHHWTRAGFIFNDWNTEANGSGNEYSAGDTLVLSSSILLYANWKQADTGKPIAIFDNFTDEQLFNVSPAAVTVSVSEAVYWIAGGAQLDVVNALPLISIKKDGAEFTAYTASFDELTHVFTLSFNGTLQDGEYEVIVAGDVVRDLSHNILEAASASFIVDQTTPDAPVLTTPPNGQWMNDSTPMISGTAEVGATVVIKLDGSIAATVTVLGNGSWSWTPTVALAEGLHTVSASATDAAGNRGSLSVEHSFTIDTQPPVIALLGDASIFLTVGTTFVDPGATVTDLEDNILVTITGSVDNQVPGIYTLQYFAQDRAGNVAVPVTRTVQVNVRSTGGGSVQPSSQLSSNADLKQLIVKAGRDELALTPVFAAGTTSYRVETSAAEVSIAAVPSDAKAIVTLEEAALVGGKTIALTKGDNKFKIIVKAENGTVKSYSLTIQLQMEIAPLPAKGSDCTFRDIKGHWAELHICEALEKGIVEGNSETEFNPQGLITRVEFAAILLRTRGVTPEPASGKLSFTDQDQIPAWATNTVSASVENGILQGYPDSSLRPMHTVSRSEIATMTVRAMKWDIEQGQMTSFADDAEIPNWAKGYINAAAQRGLLNGREGNRFSPSEPATRAEAATILLRLWHVLDEMPGKSRD